MSNERWAEVKANSDRVGERNDCAVKAFALAFDMDYDNMRELFNACGRKPRGKTSRSVYDKVLRKINGSVTPQKLVGKSLKSLELPKTGSFLVWVSGHVLAYIDGVILDWTNGRQHRPYMVCKCHKDVPYGTFDESLVLEVAIVKAYNDKKQKQQQTRKTRSSTSFESMFTL